MFSQHQSRRHWYCSALFRGVCWAAATSPAATLTTEFTTTSSKHSHLDRLQNQIQRAASWLGSLQCVLPQEKSWCFTLLLHLKEWKLAPHKSILNLSQNTSVIMLVHSLGPVTRKRSQFNENSKLALEANCSKQRNLIENITLDNITLHSYFLELIHWWMKNTTDLLPVYNTSKAHEKSVESCLHFCMRKVNSRNIWTVKMLAWHYLTLHTLKSMFERYSIFHPNPRFYRKLRFFPPFISHFLPYIHEFWDQA